ncbi:MAG: fused MFS/spermidine synthase [Magnetococcales bacterium]|nr:fused MFS/spermidine synthase [Magnetococcales bacterium]
MRLRLYALQGIAFGAAFLLFQLELIAAKALLPHFGGSFLVWSMTVMFFQGVLILGYLLVHWGTRFLGIRGWFHLYLVLLLLTLPALTTLPTLLQPLSHAEEASFLPRLLLTLFLATGVVFLALSTLGVGTQKWLAASSLPEAGNPFALYGISNLGAFVALFSYPLLVEPRFTLLQQITLWQGGYLVLALLQGITFPLRVPLSRQEPLSTASPTTPGRLRLSWFLLPAASNALYLATTNLITMDLASVPLLWTLPLGVFLVTFWLTFKARPWYPAWVRSRFYLAVPVGIFLFLLQIKGFDFDSPGLSILLHLLTLFFLSMACHGELHRLRPRDPQLMTDFYLTLAVGGFAGALLVGWLAPASGIPVLIEYPFAMLLAVLALALDPAARPLQRFDGFWVLLMVLVLLGWPLLSGEQKSLQGNLLSVLLAVPILFIFSALRDKPRPLTLALLAVVVMVPFFDDLAPDRSLLFKQRNHYGIYRIFIKDGRKILKHGTTYHGAQWLDPERGRIPQLYYHPVTPVGRLLSGTAFPWQNTGVIGLGTGSLAAYARPGQSMTFFELDPDDGVIARDHFSYLRESRGRIAVQIGDARLSLHNIPGQSYDLLVVDAFNSDAIPLHLLTTEALALYRRTLKPDGLLLFHVSNRFLDLTTALGTNGRWVGARSLSLANPPPVHADAEPSHWVAMTWSPVTTARLIDSFGWTLLDADNTPLMPRPWTDDYSNLVSVLLF